MANQSFVFHVEDHGNFRDGHRAARRAFALCRFIGGADNRGHGIGNLDHCCIGFDADGRRDFPADHLGKKFLVDTDRDLDDSAGVRGTALGGCQAIESIFVCFIAAAFPKGGGGSIPPGEKISQHVDCIGDVGLTAVVPVMCICATGIFVSQEEDPQEGDRVRDVDLPIEV